MYDMSIDTQVHSNLRQNLIVPSLAQVKDKDIKIAPRKGKECSSISFESGKTERSEAI
jgi:hypothetical protein